MGFKFELLNFRASRALKMPEAKCVSIKISEKVSTTHTEPENFAITQHHIHDEHSQPNMIDSSKLVKLASAPTNGEIGQIAVTIADTGRAGVIKRPRAIIPKPKRTDESTHLTENNEEHHIHAIKQNLREDNQGTLSSAPHLSNFYSSYSFANTDAAEQPPGGELHFFKRVELFIKFPVEFKLQLWFRICAVFGLRRGAVAI